jgi:NADH-ubiquinone oxidoreductase chain 5
LIVGWDGLGLSSFYLIIYYQNQRSLGASIITLLSNRVGDLCLLIAIGLFISLGTRFLPHITLLRLLILTACFTKRAQFPFIRWLPAAMAAPTPVSALVHSSTLVTAGVYLIIRFFRPIFEAERARFIIATISRITMFFSALRGIFETDFKKIIALSTLRQLGFIIFRISQGIKICGFFHLITHAIFKSLLFICAGAVIVLRGHNQDIRRLPKFNNLIIQRCFIVASIALIRTPFLVGFYSKDLILEMLFQNQTKN